MEPASPNPARPFLEVHGSRASSVITQKLPPGAKEVFLEWQREFSDAASRAPGYQATEIYPPASEPEPWVVILHFNDPSALKNWIESPVRAEWLARKPTPVGAYQVKTMPRGFGAYLAGLGDEHLPHWKMFLYVLLGLYPTVMLLGIFVMPSPVYLGPAATTLIGNVCSCIFLEWVGCRVMTRALGPWLRANGPEGRIVSVVGASLIVTALIGMMFLFRLITG